MKTFPALTIALLLLAPLACDGPEGEEESPVAEACEHTEVGPNNAAAASAVGDTSAGDISAAHTSHDVTLVAVAGGNGGFVRFDSVGGPTLIFVTVDLPVVATDANGAAIALTAADESECTQVVKSFSGDLPVGVVFLELGPTDATEVSIVIEAENGPEEEE
jgi:hypothetical protein